MKKTLYILLLLLGLACVKVSQGEPVSGLVFPFREVSISSPVQNFITELHVREGAEVKAGELMAQLYKRSVELDMERAAAALRKREFESKGAQNLFKERLISEDEALASEIELRLASLQYEIAQEAVALREIRASIAGIVVERHNEIGEMVVVGEPMFRVVDIDQIYVRLFLTVKDARRFPIGRSVHLTFPELGEHSPNLDGVVDFIDPRVDSASGLIQIKILANNSDRKVKPGLRATVALAPEDVAVEIELPEEVLPEIESPSASGETEFDNP
ncbi:MAG: efflux RND transporter periplasmic adaptor subunit [Puniceicoccaceae bacterium]|nr:MAG: efflux RND transporter periplasmic adaptor subunit [Puniceicoccaceae bacterium]